MLMGRPILSVLYASIAICLSNCLIRVYVSDYKSYGCRWLCSSCCLVQVVRRLGRRLGLALVYIILVFILVTGRTCQCFGLGWRFIGNLTIDVITTCSTGSPTSNCMILHVVHWLYYRYLHFLLFRLTCIITCSTGVVHICQATHRGIVNYLDHLDDINFHIVVVRTAFLASCSCFLCLLCIFGALASQSRMHT